jgi:flagellar capping protein FliD
MKKFTEEDLTEAGFHKVENVQQHPPKINWGPIYKKSTTEKDRLAYAEKLAASMNHAANLIQGERDQLGQLCEKKELQIESMKIALEQNNQMIQEQITKMNAERQLYNQEISRLKAELRNLEKKQNDDNN